MTRVVIIVSLLHIICCENLELKLISELNNFFDFDHNVFLVESSANISRFISSGRQNELATRTVYVFKEIVENITELKSLMELTSKNTFTIVALDGSSFDRNIEFFDQLKTIQRLQINMKIGFFLPKFATMDDLGKLFKWCKEHQIFNVFAACVISPERIEETTPQDLLNAFTFNPFGSFEVINLTTSEAYGNYFPSLQSNFQQHQLQVSYPFDYNFDTKFWSAVLLLMNGSFSANKNNFTDVDELFKNGIDVIVGFVPQQSERGFYVYPIFIRSWELIVPEAMPYADFSAYLQVVTSDKFFGISLIIIAAVMLFLTACRYIKHQKILFLQSVTDVLNLLMNDNGYIKYQRLSRAEALVIGPLTFVGFVIVNGILSNLQSYLTRPVLQPQIKTLEDIHNSPFTVITSGEFWKEEVVDALASRTNHQDWSDKIIAMKLEEYSKHVDLFDTSISFCEDKMATDRRFRVQKRLNVKGYYNPKLQIVNYLLSYAINEKFQFFDRFNEITHRMKSAGLIDLWLRNDIDKDMNYLLKENVERLKHLGNVDVPKIEFPMFIVYGWMASVALFVVEIILKNCKFSQIKKFPRVSRDSFGKLGGTLAGMFRR